MKARMRCCCFFSEKCKARLKKDKNKRRRGCWFFVWKTHLILVIQLAFILAFLKTFNNIITADDTPISNSLMRTKTFWGHFVYIMLLIDFLTFWIFPGQKLIAISLSRSQKVDLNSHLVNNRDMHSFFYFI